MFSLPDCKNKFVRIMIYKNRVDIHILFCFTYIPVVKCGEICFLWVTKETYKNNWVMEKKFV